MANTDLAIDAKILVSLNAKLMVVFIQGLKKQDGYPLSFVAKKVIFHTKRPEQVFDLFTIQAKLWFIEGVTTKHMYQYTVKKSFNDPV